MISVYKIKPQFQKLLTPILEYFHRRGITANQITVSALVLSVIIAVLFYLGDHSRWLFLVLPVGLLARMALNALDGMMARRFNQMSAMGEMLNELGDVLSDMIIFLPLLKFFPQAGWSIVIFIGLSIINEFAGVLGKVIAGDRRYDGPMGKSDRALVLGILGILLCCQVNLSGAAVWIFTVMDVLLGISTFLRVKRALHGVPPKS